MKTTKVIALRVMLALSILLSIALIPMSLAQGTALGIAAWAMLMDAVFNDYLPRRASIPFLRKHRSRGYAVVAALCIAALMPSALVGLTPAAVLAALLAQASAACALAVASSYTKLQRKTGG